MFKNYKNCIKSLQFLCFGVIWGHPKKSKNLYKYISHGTKFISGEFCECTYTINSRQNLLKKPVWFKYFSFPYEIWAENNNEFMENLNR